nr:ribonuclease P protein component [Caldimonas mangrovi]
MPAALAVPAEADTGRTPVQHLKQRADFERALGAGPAGVVARSTHFVLHFVPPAAAAAPAAKSAAAELSTGLVPSDNQAVDCPARAGLQPLVGAVIPKRWARRSVTRNLLKRQVFASFERQPVPIPPGVWVVRLRVTFDREQFHSPASDTLKRAARGELDSLLGQGLARVRRASAPRPPASS